MRAIPRYRVQIIGVLTVLALLGWWISHDEQQSLPSDSTPEQVVTTPATAFAPSTQPAVPAPAAAPPVAQGAIGGSIRGRVIDAATKLPIQEFRLELNRFASIEGREVPEPKTFRDRDGRFEWANVQPDRWRLTANAVGYQRFELDGVHVSASAATSEILIPLRRGYALSGRVYDQSTGTGIANAQITFREAHVERFAQDWRGRAVFRTDQRGAFRLEGLPAARVTLSVSAADYADREIDVVASQAASTEIALSAGGTIAGLLTEADGATPISGSVGLVQLEQGFGSTIDTQPNGEFAFRKLAAGRYRLIGKTTTARGERELQITGDERIEGVVLAVQGGGTIRGLIRGVRAQDMSRLSITVRRPNAGMTAPANARIDEHGAYVLNGVEAGRMVVIADVAMRRQLSKIVDMPPNGDLTVDFDFPAGVRLSGHITRGGEPLARTMLEPQHAAQSEVKEFLYPTATGPNGEYAIEGLAQGEYVLRVAGYSSPMVRVYADTVFDVDVPLTAHFSGRVVESDGEIPIVGASVDIWPFTSATTPTASRARLRASSDHAGSFALSGLEPGEFVVTVYKPGYEMYREQLTYGSPVDNRVIRLGHSRGVNVRIRDARTGEPLRVAAATELLKGGTGLHVPLHPDENGDAQLPAALAGSDIAFSAAGFFTAVVPRWGGESLTLSLKPEKPIAD